MLRRNLLKLNKTKSIKNFIGVSNNKIFVNNNIKFVNNNIMMNNNNNNIIKRFFSNEDMFCFQCGQTENSVACTSVGVCGKEPSVAKLQDLLVDQLKALSAYSIKYRSLGHENAEIDLFIRHAMFSSLTNVNFDAIRIQEYIKEAEKRIKKLHKKLVDENVSVVDLYRGTEGVDEMDMDTLIDLGDTKSILRRKELYGDDIVGLQEMIVYAVKGAMAYYAHASRLNQFSQDLENTLQSALVLTLKTDPQVDELLGEVLKVGEANLQAMKMLDEGHVNTLGHPEPAKVSRKPEVGKCILVSGHDLVDLKNLLEQTDGLGINIYTHGEMLPAHGYPELRKYSHLKGHYGHAWQLQKFEFANFPGPILMTSNCIIEPKKSYKNRIFTTASVGFPGVQHIEMGDDFQPVIDSALKCNGFDADDVAEHPEKYFTTGFARNTILSVAGDVINAVNAGKISRFFVVGGCDGTEGNRSYFTDIVKEAPNDAVFLTLGCGKYRINDLDLGDIGGIPRLLDLGQCNDAYSGIQVAVALAEAFKLKDVNDLPLSFAVSWFEQKAVAVLATLLHLGIRNIRLGPTIPGFATPQMVQILNEKFNLMPIDAANPVGDVQKMMSGN